MDKNINQEFQVHTYFFLFLEVINITEVTILEGIFILSICRKPLKFKFLWGIYIFTYLCTYLNLWKNNKQFYSNLYFIKYVGFIHR